jgi:hypothetical protein
MFVGFKWRLTSQLATAGLLIGLTGLSPWVVEAQTAASGHVYVLNNNPASTEPLSTSHPNPARCCWILGGGSCW